jgi:DNA-binding beta-propeller fold protein YncE
MAFHDRNVTPTFDTRANLPVTYQPGAKLLLIMLLTAGMLCSISIVSAQSKGQDSVAAATEPATKSGDKPPATDSLGDPLSPAAILRFGTTRFHAPTGVDELVLSPDEKTLVSVGNHLIVWDPATGKERWRADSDQSRRGSSGSRYGSRPVAFSSDSSHFFTTNGQHQIAIWDIASKKQEILDIKQKEGNLVKALDDNLSIDVTSNEKMFVLGNSNGVVVFDRQGTVKFEVANVIDGPFKRDDGDRLSFFGPYSCGRFSPDGTKLAVLTSDRPDVIRIYETETGRELQKISLVSKLVRLAFSPDSKQMVATERDSSVRLYDINSGARLWSHTVELKNPFENYTSAFVYSPGGIAWLALFAIAVFA